jgi:hypothetical protein
VDRIEREDGRPFAAVLDSDLGGIPELAGLGSDLEGRTVVPASGYVFTENSTALSVRAPGAGVLVLTEAFWHGYPRAELNGEPVRTLRVNHAFQGVVIPAAGEYRLIVHYRSPVAAAAWSLAGLGWALLAAWAAALYAGNRKAPA